MFKAIVLLVIALFAVSALAQTDPGLDGIGIYFDPDGVSNCATQVPYTQVTAYLVATRISAPSGMVGWAARILYNPAEIPAGVTYTLLPPLWLPDPGPAYPDVVVSLPWCLPAAPAIPLLTISFFHLGGQALFGVGPAYPFSADPQGPGYAPCGEPDQLIALVPSGDVAWPGVPGGYVVAAVNPTGGCPVPVGETSWGAVKALYE